MGVSRETCGDNSSSFSGVVGGDLSYRATLGQNEGLLPFFLSFLRDLFYWLMILVFFLFLIQCFDLAWSLFLF